MSWQATAWALQQQTGSSAGKLTLLALANYADENGICWPSQERLAAETEQSVDTVQRRIKQLCALGLVRVERREGARGQWAGKIYYLDLSVAKMTKPQNAVRSNDEQSTLNPLPPCRTAAADHAANTSVTIPQSLRHKPSLRTTIEPSRAHASAAAVDRLQAFQKTQEGSEVVQNRIAQRIGHDGWNALGAMSDAVRARLTTLERRKELDDVTLQAAVLNTRCARPP